MYLNLTIDTDNDVCYLEASHGVPPSAIHRANTVLAAMGWELLSEQEEPAVETPEGTTIIYGGPTVSALVS